MKIQLVIFKGHVSVCLSGIPFDTVRYKYVYQNCPSIAQRTNLWNRTTNETAKFLVFLLFMTRTSFSSEI